MGAPEARTSAAGGFDERFFHLLADAIPHLVWSSSVDGEDDYCNRRACEYTGLSARELGGLGWEAIVHPDDLERCRLLWNEARSSGTRYEIEYRLRRHDGAYLWHHSTAEAVRMNGRIVRWFGTSTDIDARKRVEDSLRELQRTTRIVADGIPHMLWTAGPDGRLDFLNARCLEYTGLSANETRTGKWQEVIHPHDRGDCIERWQRALRDGQGFQAEYRLRRHDGAYRWHSHTVMPLRDPSGNILLWYGTCTDVEDQKALTGQLQALVASRTEALAESEQRFRSFMDSMPVVAWIKDAAFRYRWINDGYRLRRRRSLEQVVGRDDFEIQSEAVARQFREGDEEALRRNAPVQSVRQDRGEDGAAVHWLVVRFPLPDASGKMGVGGIAIDISERVELERALRENEVRVVKATETVRQLMNRLVHAQEAERHRLAGDLHDLVGQKLTALGINLDIVRQQMPQAGASRVAGRLHQMSTLLEETIVAIREVMADLRPPALEEHGLSAALHQYAAAFEARTGLHVEVSAEAPRTPLPDDVSIALFRIAQEALTNAAKHSGASRALVRLRKSPDAVELQVEDDGCGLRETAAERRRTSGGWGLRMMRERAEAFGGRLAIVAAHPGTRIVVDVPLTHADKRHPR